jgi:hypothetical protein
MRLVLPILGCALALAGCGAGEHSAAQSDVGRNFDSLAGAVAECADAMRQCGDEDDAGKTEKANCRDEFLSCRSSAGKSAESDLVEAIATCQEEHGKCEADAGDAKECSQALRVCIGEARAQAKESSDAAAPNPHAPTYQCFGQLRECATSGREPRDCAAEARACVIAAIGDPPEVHRPSGQQPPAAGAGGKGEAGKGEAGKGEAGKGEAGKGDAGKGDAGKGGAGAGAGGAGTAGSRPTAGAGAGGSMQPPIDCAKQHEACMMSGDDEKKCSREQRMCEKQN